MRVLREFDLTTDGDRARQRAFSLQTRCVTSLYARLFPKFRTERCWKVLINCVGANAQPYYRDLLGVYELDVEADVSPFFDLPDAQRKVWAFEQLRRGIDQLLQQTNWDREPFALTFAKAGELGLQNVWRWRAAASPSRRTIAEVWVDHGVQACLISLVIRDRAGQELSRHELISELPDEWVYSLYLGSLRWDSDSRVALISKDNQRSWPVEF